MISCASIFCRASYIPTADIKMIISLYRTSLPWSIAHIPSHLYGLALIYFNNMKVEAVDAFAWRQKYRVQCEIVSYVDKNL